MRAEYPAERGEPGQDRRGLAGDVLRGRHHPHRFHTAQQAAGYNPILHFIIIITMLWLYFILYHVVYREDGIIRIVSIQPNKLLVATLYYIILYCKYD